MIKEFATKKWETFSWRGFVFKRNSLCGQDLQWHGVDNDRRIWIHSLGDGFKSFLHINLIGWYESSGVGKDPKDSLENALSNTRQYNKEILNCYLKAQSKILELENYDP